MTPTRRALVKGIATSAICASLPWSAPGAAALGTTPLEPFSPAAGARSRLLFLNDLSGDLDGIYAAAHAVLSPSLDIRGIVGTGTGRPKETSVASAQRATEMLSLMGRTRSVDVHTGATGKMTDARTPVRSAGTDLIIREARRTDTSLPLVVAVGGGLTEVASAVLLAPDIAERFTLVWIGGDAYPTGGVGETNFSFDRLAARFLFNETTVPIWQVPRSVYATCLVSASELQVSVAPYGAIGAWLYDKVATAPARFGNALNMGETWTMGDSPLVLLTALADWTPSGRTRPLVYGNFGSSPFDDVVAPRLNEDGTFSPRTEGRRIRIFRGVDTRLMFADFFAKLKLNYPA